MKRMTLAGLALVATLGTAQAQYGYGYGYGYTPIQPQAEPNASDYFSAEMARMNQANRERARDDQIQQLMDRQNETEYRIRRGY